MTIALLPLRDPGRGKTRLEAVLPPAGRAELAAAMATDVIDAIRDAGVDRIVLAAGGPEAEQLGVTLDVEVVRDPPGVKGLNGALAAAIDELGGQHDVLVVAADLPGLTGDDVTAVLRSDAQVVVAPTRGGGTGGLLRRPAAVIPTAYGPGSARRHLDLAVEAGASTAEIHRSGFLRDTDTADDLRALAVADPLPRPGTVGPHTARWLQRWNPHADRIEDVTAGGSHPAVS